LGARWLVVNADDFGFTPDVNDGIVEAHRRGILTATTLMANGAATPSMALRSDNTGLHFAYIGDVTAQRGRRGHRGAHEVSASTPSLASLEVAICR